MNLVKIRTQNLKNKKRKKLKKKTPRMIFMVKILKLRLIQINLSLVGVILKEKRIQLNI